MTRQPPPARFTGAPADYLLPAGRYLSRVHGAAYPGASFNPVASDVLFGGGRFDATADDRYGFLYAAETDEAAVAEALLRDIDANDRGARFLAKKYWCTRQLSRMQTTVPLPLISLRSGADLGAIGQDTWLTTCDPDDYPQSRAWAHWLRSIASDACGIIWVSKREPTAHAVVLFEDRCPPGAIVPAPGPLAAPCEFGQAAGFQWLRGCLAKYRVAIRK